MTEHADLVAAILANPTDRLHQLVYADWLDEHGCPDTTLVIRTQGIIKRFIGDGDGDGDGGGYGGEGQLTLTPQSPHSAGPQGRGGK